MSYTIDRFWVTAEIEPSERGAAAKGQMYVEHLVPTQPNGRAPYLFIHGGGGQGLDWLQTPDARPGWAPLLADRGYDVYVVDRIGHGRSPYDSAKLGALAPAMQDAVFASLFFPPANGEGSHPTSSAHTQWPGESTLDDPAVIQLLASQSPMLADTERAQRLDQAALAALLERVGKVVVFSHSAGGPAGFLLADICPEKVISLVACEPLGPPLIGAPGSPLSWGVANAPLSYAPSVSTPSDISYLVNDSGPVPLALQTQPARRLVQLAKVPIFLVTAEASVFRWFETSTAAYLQQAGCCVTSIRLWEHGVFGNSHGFMLEKNNAEILDLILATIQKAPAPALTQ
ncbi:alpha/beta fold hydrolase [Variovorax sp. LT1R16]|uniref:alpha/beta fold hydrolase n=1 Tax=Variovorax sp. LT1R16 TaxID=3443728 RepID=UPI003F481A54